MLSASSKIGSATLTVDRLRSAVESGHPATGGVKYDTPKQVALESALQSALTAYASRLTVEGSESRLLSDNIRTAKDKADKVRVIRTSKSDCGEAVKAVAWLHNLRAYVGAIARDGRKAVSRKIRNGLVLSFSTLKPADLAALNVGDDDKAGFGLCRAKTIIGNMSAAESEAVAKFDKRNGAAADKASTKAALKIKASTRKPTRKPAKRGAYGITVRNGGVKITGNGKPADDGSTFHHTVIAAPIAAAAPLTV